MSNIIPPLLSNTPPPITESLDEGEDDEFGIFTSAADISCTCEGLSLPPSPHLSPLRNISQSENDENLDINSNKNKNNEDFEDFHSIINKDYHDKRKICDALRILSENVIETEVNLQQNFSPQICISSVNSIKVDDSTSTKHSSKSEFCKENLPNNSVPTAINLTETNKTHDANITNFVITPTTNEITNDDSSVPDCNSSETVEKLSRFANCTADVDLNVPCSPKQTEFNLSNPNVSYEEKYNLKLKDDVNTNCLEENDFNLVGEPPDININVETNSKFEIESYSLSTDHDLTEDSCLKDALPQQLENVLHEEPPECNINDDNETFDDFNYYPTNVYDFDDTVTPLNINVSHNDQVIEKDDDNKLTTKNTPTSETKVKDSNNDTNISDPVDHFQNFSNSVQTVDNHADAQNSNFDRINNEDFGQFADFATTFESDSETISRNEDDFGEFNNFQNLKPSTEDDDFGDFDDYTNASSSSGFVTFQYSTTTEFVDNKDILQKVEKVIKDMFPSCEQQNDEFAFTDIVQGDFIYREIKDVTETNALTYQWVNSSSQDSLLNALNIDTRNILYGPSWNPSMPKFAANLTLAPLEPMKPEILTPTLPPNTNSVSSQSNRLNQGVFATTEIPSAQFDWIGAGLTNPLDYTPANTMLLDIEQLVASLDINNCPTVTSQSPSPVDNYDEWHYWLKSLPNGNQELSSANENQLENISNVSNVKINETQTSPSNYLQSKSHMQGDNDSVNSLRLVTELPNEIEEVTKFEVTKNDNFEELASYKASHDSNFSNWSSVLPLRETYITNQHTSDKMKNTEVENDNGEPGWLKPTILTPDLPRKMHEEKEYDDEFTEFQMNLGPSNMKETNINTCCKTEDDYSDFQSNVTKYVLPTTLINSHFIPSVSSVMEPLKPVILQNNSEGTMQINWPDPGITEDDILNIELNYSNKRASIDLSINSTLEMKFVNSDKNMDLSEVDKHAQQQNEICENNKFSQLIEKQKTNSLDRSTTNQQKDSLKSKKDVESVGQAENSIYIQNVLFNSSNIVPCQSIVTKNDFTIKNRNNGSGGDDDEWSDFVCNPEPVQCNNQGNNFLPAVTQRERTNSVLQLSVPQLCQIQPPKLPIPVITPHGLIQTKIPSNIPSMNAIMSPSVRSNQVQSNGTFVPLSNYDIFQPSIISNQYQSHVGGPITDKSVFSNNYLANTSNSNNYTNGFTQQTKHVPKTSIQPQVEKPSQTPINNIDDDDDWTDFISSPSVATSSQEINVTSKDFDWQSKGPNFSSWSTTNFLTPNIITNPVHYNSLHNYIPQCNNVLNSKTNKKVTNVALHSKRTAVPSISALPDLDFIAPKNRTKK